MPRLVLVFVLLSVCALGASAQITPPIEPPTLPSDRLPWSSDEVEEAAVALHVLAQEQPTALPRYTVGSRSMFSRLTALAVVDEVDAADPYEQVGRLQRLVRTYDQVLLIYARLQQAHGTYDVEVAELSRVLMRASAGLAMAVAALPPPEDEAQVFQAGVLRVRMGLAEMMRGVVLMAADAEILSLPARERLLLYAAQESHVIVSLLPEAERQALAGDIQAASANAPTALAKGFRVLRAVYAP